MALKDNVTNYWKLDGNSNDSVGGLNGTDTSISYVTGKINQGAGFDSGTDKISFSSTTLISGTSDFTLSLWIKYTSGVFIISRRDASVFNWQLVYNAGKLYFTIGATNLFDGSNITLDSNWHHIVITRASTTNWVLYKDGSSVSTSNVNNSIATGKTLTFGDDSASENSSMIGTLDEVGVWSRAISADEVTQLYNSGNGSQYPFPQNIVLTLATGSYTLTGQNSIFGRVIVSTLVTGLYSLTGSLVSFTSTLHTYWTAKVINPTYWRNKLTGN